MTTAQAVIERPILMSGAMVRATLADIKTETRRAMNPQPVPGGGWDWSCPIPKKFKCTPGSTIYWADGTAPGTATTRFYCPYGKPGDRLWVREAWRVAGSGAGLRVPELSDAWQNELRYRADHDDSYIDTFSPSIHMPRWASRILLELTDIRVERLQDISEESAIAEGVGFGFQMNAGWPDYRYIKNGVCGLTQDSARMSYSTLWDTINAKRAGGKYRWDANPWVWVLKFKRLKP